MIQPIFTTRFSVRQLCSAYFFQSWGSDLCQWDEIGQSLHLNAPVIFQIYCFVSKPERLKVESTGVEATDLQHVFQLAFKLS